MKDMSRALRRFHAARLKRERRFYSGIDNAFVPRRLGRLVHTPAMCSCWMCGHRRRHEGPTLAERRHLAALAEQS